MNPWISWEISLWIFYTFFLNPMKFNNKVSGSYLSAHNPSVLRASTFFYSSFANVAWNFYLYAGCECNSSSSDIIMKIYFITLFSAANWVGKKSESRGEIKGERRWREGEGEEEEKKVIHILTLPVSLVVHLYCMGTERHILCDFCILCLAIQFRMGQICLRRMA